MGSARKNEKIRSKDKDRKVASAHPTPLIPKVCGCPVPDPIRCFSGKPLPFGGDGVRMECSNEKCPFENVLLHQECFEAFENHLVKILSNLGSARGWTDAQRRANLWDKKGQSLIAKVCRCRCGLGLTRMDELAAYNRLKQKTHEQAEAQREAALAAGRPTPSLKKKHRTKNVLPILNFGMVKTSHKVVLDEHEPRSMIRRSGAKFRDVSASTVSSTPISCLALESRRESLTYASDAWVLLSMLPSDTRTHTVMSGHVADRDDTISTSSKNEFIEGSPSILGHDSATEKSSSARSSEDIELMSFKDLAPPLKDCVMTLPSLTSLPFGNTHDVHSASFMSSECVTPTENLGKLEHNVRAFCGCYEEILTWLKYQSTSPRRTRAPGGPSSRKGNVSDEETTSIPEWHLFGGRSFELGESIFANLFLPIWNVVKRSEVPTEL